MSQVQDAFKQVSGSDSTSVDVSQPGGPLSGAREERGEWPSRTEAHRFCPSDWGLEVFGASVSIGRAD